MERTKKFSDLTTGTTYIVKGYNGPINSAFSNSYILLVTEKDSDVEFEIWSTNLLAQYIKDKSPTDKFTFTVNERNNNKYPVIEGYKKARTFKLLN